MGGTSVTSAVTAELVEPSPDRPEEGLLTFSVDFSPMASPYFEANRPTPKSVEVGRMVRTIYYCKPLHLFFSLLCDLWRITITHTDFVSSLCLHSVPFLPPLPQVERCVKDAGALDTETLCVLAGSKVWAIRVDIRVSNFEGTQLLANG